MTRISAAETKWIDTTLAGLATALFIGGSAMAQSLPTPAEQEVLAKTTILTLNNANLTGDYEVLHAKLSKPFRDQFDADKLAETFKDFVDKQLDLSPIADRPAVSDVEAQIDGDGVLTLRGHFATSPKQVKYQLGFIRSDGEWKPVGIKVDVE
jgi:hypothetical protein